MELVATTQLLGRGGGGGEDMKSETAAAARIAAAAETTVTEIFPSSFSPEAGGSEEEKKVPKKRAFALAAFLACISFLVFFINLVVSFCNDLIQNERVWNHLALWIAKIDNKTNKKI